MVQALWFFLFCRAPCKGTAEAAFARQSPFGHKTPGAAHEKRRRQFFQACRQRSFFGGREAFFCACLRFQLVSGVPLSLAM